MNTKNAIAVLPYNKWPNFNLSELSLDELRWPLGRPDRLKNGYIKNLTKEDHIITFPRKVVFIYPRPKIKANISVIIVEPDAIHQKYLSWSRNLNWRFYKVLSKNKNLLSNINNGKFFYFGSTFINNPSEVNCTKKKMVSLIASKRNYLKGHKLRHEIVSKVNTENIDVMGRAYKAFDKKEDGLAQYNYSIVIENVQEKDYFTEKIVDACLCNTVPIYWGCPNISDYFDTRGIIICQSAEDIMDAIDKLSDEDYQSRLNWIRKNYKLALEHADYSKRAAQIIQNSIINKN